MTPEPQKQDNVAGGELPLVSVCIGVYNRRDLVRECLDSVFAQTYRNFEVIVADNASTDDTLAIVETYPGVRIVRRNTNSGMCSTTRNLAASAARGDYIAFLDSDDAWYPEKLARQVSFMESNRDIPLCHTYCHLMDEHSRVYGIRHEGVLPPTGDCFEALIEHCWITISSAMIRRALFQECGPFTETLPYGKSGEDYEFFLKVARRHSIGLLDDVLVKYRKSVHGITAGNWRGLPQPVPFLRELLRRTDIWEGRVDGRRMRARYLGACHENSVYWRERGFRARALWASWQALSVFPFAGASWASGLRTLARSVLPSR